MGNQLLLGLGEGSKLIPFAIALSVLFRLAKFPDFGATATLTLGASVFVAAAQHGISPHWCWMLAMIAGILPAALNGVLFLKLNVHPLLSSILTMAVMFGVSLLILDRHPTVALPARYGLNEFHAAWIGVCEVLLLSVWLSSRYGVASRFAGENPVLLKRLGIRHHLPYMLLLFAGSMAGSLAGAVLTAIQGGVNVNSGRDYLFPTIIALLLGENIVALIAIFASSLHRKLGRSSPIKNGMLCQFATVASGTNAWIYLWGAILGCLVERSLYQFVMFYWGADLFTTALEGFVAAAMLIVSRRIIIERFPGLVWSFHERFQ